MVIVVSGCRLPSKGQDPSRRWRKSSTSIPAHIVLIFSRKTVRMATLNHHFWTTTFGRPLGGTFIVKNGNSNPLVFPREFNLVIQRFDLVDLWEGRGVMVRSLRDRVPTGKRQWNQVWSRDTCSIGAAVDGRSI